MRRGVHEDVLGLDVSMADALCVDVRDSAEQLVRIELDQDVWDHLLHLEVLLHDSVDSVGNIVHDHIQIHLVGLVAISVERLPHFHVVRVVEHLQDRELSVLVPLVLEHFLDGDGLASLCNRGLEHHSEGAVANDFLRVVGEALLKLRRSRLRIN